MSHWQVRIWRWVAGVFALLVILFAALAGLFRLASPLVPGYRQQVEQWASAALQHPVQIHSMSADLGWYGPEVELLDVRILSRDKARTVVAAREVHLGVSLWSLLHGSLPRPDRIVLVGPQVSVERDAAGAFSIVGLEGAAPKSATDWQATLREVFAQSAEIVVKDGRVDFRDAHLRAPALFQKLDLRIENAADKHDIQGGMQLPPVFGKSLKFELHIAGEGIDPKQWDWKARLRGSTLELPQIFAYWPAYAGRFAGGELDLDASAAGRAGALTHAGVEFDGRNFVPAPKAFPSVGGFEKLDGRVEWKRGETGWRLEAKHLQLQRGALAWPAGSFDLEYVRGTPDTWSGDAGFLRLQDLTVLASWLPPELVDTKRLLAFAPSGDVSDASFRIQTDGKTLGEWAVKSRFLDLGVRAAEGQPGFAGVDGAVDLNQQGGSVMLASRNFSVDFTPLFRAPLRADSLDMTARVSHDADGWRVASDGFTAASSDGAGHGHGGMFFPADGSAPVLDLDVAVERADARNKSAYFPVGIMPKQVVDWLDSAIQGGQVTGGSVSIHGKTSDFPYRDGKGGTFDIRFHLVHGELDYAPGWPALKDLDADVRFLDQGLTAEAHGGKVQDDDIQPSHAAFADLASGVLEVQGAARGSAANGLEFLRGGPLKDRFGGYLDGLEAKGQTDVTLELHLPVTDLHKFTLKGRATLRDVSVGLKSYTPLTAQHMGGDVDFSGTGFGSQGVNGMLLGGPVNVVIRPDPRSPDITTFTAKGRAHADGVAEVLSLGKVGWLAGDTAWRVDGKIPNGPGAAAALSLNLRSDLTGLGVGLPAPFTKDAGAPLPLRLNLKLVDEGRLELGGSYASLAQLKLAFSHAGGAWGFDRGNLSIGPGSATLPNAPGLLISGTLPEFDWDTWQALLPASPSPPMFANGAAYVLNVPLPSLLGGVDLDIGHLRAFGQSMDDLHLSLARASDVWQARVDGAALSGSLLIPFTVDVGHPIAVDMERVILSKPQTPPPPATSAPAAASAAATPAADVNAPQYDPRHVPALRFTSKRLQYGEMALDNVSLTVVPQPDGVTLQDLQVTTPTTSVSGDGSWKVTPAGVQQTVLNADVESKDVEKTLQALGYDAGITGDKGSIISALNWRGSPFADVVKTLGGTLKIKLEDGQLKDVKPGAGRVFGLLSLNALPRRLLLNFSDVFAKGFGYDSIEGDFTLQDGDAYTKDLQLKGPAARITIVGRTGLAKQDFDEALIVDANVGSTLPVLAAGVAGLGVGAVVWLLGEIFKKPLNAAVQSQYHLTGGWDNPMLTKMATAPPAASKVPAQP